MANWSDLTTGETYQRQGKALLQAKPRSAQQARKRYHLRMCSNPRRGSGNCGCVFRRRQPPAIAGRALPPGPRVGGAAKGGTWGEVPGMAIDAKAKSTRFIVPSRRSSSSIATGKSSRCGREMFAWPHGIRIDRFGNLWITDGQRATASASRCSVQPRRKAADDARHERRARRRARHVRWSV